MTDRHGPREPGTVAAMGVAAVLGLAALGLGATALGVGLLLCGLAGVLAVAVGPREPDREHVGDIVVPSSAGPDAAAIATEQRRLRDQLADPAQVTAVLRPRVAALVRSKLERHGLDPDGPDAATLLGEPLRTFVTTPRTTPLPLREFEAMLTRAEAL